MASNNIRAGERISDRARELYLGSRCMVELDLEPSPVEFLRYQSRSIPFIVRNQAQPASALWSVEHLRACIGDDSVTVSWTPDGWADSVRGGRFLLPCEEVMSMSAFLDIIERQRLHGHHSMENSSSGRSNFGGGVYYCQRQDDCLRTEFARLFERGEVRPDIPWVSTALDQQPEAVNIWIGTRHSQTSLHKDNYENVYSVIRGAKTFILYPPTDVARIRRTNYPVYRYQRAALGYQLQQVLTDSGEPLVTPWYPLPSEIGVGPFVVNVRAGDHLYLPAHWYHHVTQESDSDCPCISVNYWYSGFFPDFKSVVLDELSEM